MQLINDLAAPLQLLLIIPFVRLGELLVHAPRQPLSVSDGLRLIAAGPLHTVSVLWVAIVHAAIGWALAGPPFIYLAYLALQPLVLRIVRTRTSA